MEFFGHFHLTLSTALLHVDWFCLGVTAEAAEDHRIPDICYGCCKDRGEWDDFIKH